MKAIIVFCLFYLIDCNDFYMRREYSLMKPFSGSWDFFGTAVMTNDYIRLTNNQQSQIGGMINLNPNSMRDWEIHLNFKIHGNNGKLFGDGLAFWYTAKPLQPGPIFGNQNFFKGLSIFLDTYSNHNGPHHHVHPYISAMVNNGTLNYDHDTDGTHTQIAGCSAQFRNRDHETIIAIRFTHNKLTVSHNIDNDNKWTECFAVDNVRLPLGYYFGVSAATGELSDNHDIVSIKSYDIEIDHSMEPKTDLYNFEPFAELMESPRDHKEDDQPSSVWRVVKGVFYGIILIVCCVGLFVGYYLYKRNEQQRKRFY